MKMFKSDSQFINEMNDKKISDQISSELPVINGKNHEKISKFELHLPRFKSEPLRILCILIELWPDAVFNPALLAICV